MNNNNKKFSIFEEDKSIDMNGNSIIDECKEEKVLSVDLEKKTGTETSKSEVESFIEKMPAEKRAEFYKIIYNAGLREDDHLWSMLHVYGYIKTMYEDIPGAFNELSENLEEQVKVSGKKFDKVLNDSATKIEKRIQLKIDELVKIENEISLKLDESSTKYLALITKSNKGYSDVIESERMKVKNSIVETFTNIFPDIANNHLSKLVDNANDSGLKNIVRKSIYALFFVVCGSLFSESIINVVHRIF